MVVPEENQEQHKPNSAAGNISDQNRLNDSALETTGDANTADHGDKLGGIDDSANRSDSVAVVEKQEQLEDESDDVMEGKVITEGVSVSVANTEAELMLPEQEIKREEAVECADVAVDGIKTEGVSVANTEAELILPEQEIKREEAVEDADVAVAEVHEAVDGIKTVENQKSFLLEPNSTVEEETGTHEEQAEFMKELEIFHKERRLEFKPPRFYGEPLNCLKLWRSVIRHGGYEQVTSGKVWRQVGESFNPPKTCTTVSWTFRCFYEKALLEYEKYKMSIGELPFSDTYTEPASSVKQPIINQTPGSGRARRDAAARAMQGWHSQRLLGNGEVADPIIKDRTPSTTVKRDKRDIGLLKRKKPSPVERAVKLARMKALKPQLDSMVVDVGLPADWVKINVQRTKDCFEVYALVPGLLREEVRVQSDPVGRLVISGEPEQLDNPWGVSPFKKVVSLPSRIDPHQTSAVVTLHGQLFVRVPFEQPAL